MIVRAKEKFSIDYIDPSSFSCFNRCPAKYLFSRLMALENVNRNTMAMDYGTDIHEALPYCYSMDTLDQAISIFKQRWLARGHEWDSKRNTDVAESLLTEFAVHHSRMCPYEVVEFPITAPTNTPISKNEIPFLIDVGGPLPFAGRIDAPVRWKSDGTLWALDYKTSVEVSQRLFNNFTNCPQSIGYTLALTNITGEKVSGFVLEAIRVSDKNQESQMAITSIKQCQIESFIEQCNHVSRQIIECNEKKEWAMNYSACSPYSQFGSPGYPCDYIDICTNPDKDEMMKFFRKGKRYHPYEIGE